MIAVTDTGTGMDQTTLSRVFEPFFTTKQVGYGTGLGLSQVYGFVKQSNGHIALRSQPGAGTTVELYLPRLATGNDHQHVACADADSDPGVHRGETVLVVEDNVEVRLYSTEALRELGYDVLEAADGAAALALLDRHPRITLLFTDIGLPGGLNGRQLAHEALRRKAGLKVLLTTGYAQTDSTAQLPNASVPVLVKPFSFPVLAARIRHILDDRSVRPPM